MVERTVVAMETIRGLVRPVITLGTVASGIYLGVMEALGHAKTPEWFIAFVSIVFMFLIGLSFVSLGIAIASKIESHEGFQMIMSFLIMPMFFLSGALYPINTLPGWLKVLTYIDPLTYGIDGLRYSIQGSSVAQFPIWLDFGVLSLFCLFTLLFGAHLFKKS